VTDRLGGNCRRQILQSSIINQFNQTKVQRQATKRVKTKCRWNHKLIAQFCCTFRDEHFESNYTIFG
jgi:hypothetical protein